MTEHTVHVLPFGKHRDQPLPDVPTSYLRWLAREAKLSTGLGAAVRAELERRGVAAPSPPPKPPRRCPQCKGEVIKAIWITQRDGRRVIRGSCARCNCWVGTLPMTPEYVALADAGSDSAALLTLLIRLDAAGVEVRLEGDRLVYEPRERMTRELWDLERQARDQLRARLTPAEATTRETR